MNERDWQMLIETPPEWDMLNDIYECHIPPFSEGDKMKWQKHCTNEVRPMTDSNLKRGVIIDERGGK